MKKFSRRSRSKPRKQGIYVKKKIVVAMNASDGQALFKQPPETCP